MFETFPWKIRWFFFFFFGATLWSNEIIHSCFILSSSSSQSHHRTVLTVTVQHAASRGNLQSPVNIHTFTVPCCIQGPASWPVNGRSQSRPYPGGARASRRVTKPVQERLRAHIKEPETLTTPGFTTDCSDICCPMRAGRGTGPQQLWSC